METPISDIRHRAFIASVPGRAWCVGEGRSNVHVPSHLPIVRLHTVPSRASLFA